MKRFSNLFRGAFLGALFLSACGGVTPGDPHADGGVPNTLGDGDRIRVISNPDDPKHAPSGATVTITAASTIIVDNFDETRAGLPHAVYLQDFGSNAPYSGMALYRPSFSPTNLHLTPGDVVDLTGTYQENNSIPTQFPKGEYLIQVADPQVSLRYEYKPPMPVEIRVEDLATYATGRKWLSMLVTIKNLDLPTASSGLVDDGSGRKTAYITSSTAQSAPRVTNELFDLGKWNDQTHAIKPGAHLKSLTGVVTYFFAMHIAPRSPEDIEQ
jgi:hypothetical protein